MSQRLIFSAVALAPALAALAVPGFVQGPVLGMIGPFGVSSLAIFLAFVAVHATRRTRDKEEQAGLRDEGTLLTAAAHHTPPIDIPDTEELRARVAARLVRRHCPDNKPFGPAEPDSMDFALSRIVGQVVDLWEADSAEALSETQLRELHVLETLALADAVAAGKLAQSFRNPALATDIRDQISALAERREAFEEARDAYRATLDLADSAARPWDLKTSLMLMSAPDADLWHRVIAEGDLRDPGLRAAALWCLEQPTLSRASVALFFARLGRERLLTDAEATGDTLFLRGARHAIRRWNEGGYRNKTIGLDPANAVVDAGPALKAELGALAEDWPFPEGAFDCYSGGVARPRRAWDIQAGVLIGTPQPQDYFDPV